MAAEEEWDVTSLNSVPLSTASDWEILSNTDDCAYHSDDELLSLRSSPTLARQRSSSPDAAEGGDGDGNASTVNIAATEAEIERLRRELRASQTQLQRVEAELESTHIEVADAVLANTNLQRELDQQRDRSQRQIVEMKANAEEQQRRINELNRRLVVSSLGLARRQQGPGTTVARRQRKNVVSAAVRSRPAKKWFASHNHRSQYAVRRAPRGQKVSKRRGNDRH